jgi:hypothetical protein
MLKGANKIILAITIVIIVIFSCRTKRHVVEIVPVYEDTLLIENTQKDTSTSVIVYQAPKPVVPVIPIDTLKVVYEDAFQGLKDMLEGTRDLNFKKAVFIVENAYFKGGLSYDIYNKKIQVLVDMSNGWMGANSLTGYRERDSINFLKNMAIFKVLKDTIYYFNDKKFGIVQVASYPYEYDFDDFFGGKDWSKMFVSKLLDSQTGNCHSMPYLYKILANELGATAYIALAPSHSYIKNRTRAHGWFNTELTSGAFPTDAWITASGYISMEAIRNSIFMDTLSQKQSVGLCVYDLAKGYERQKGCSDNFILKCCDLVLKYHPANVNAMLLKAETLKKQFEATMKSKRVTYPAQIFYDVKAKSQYEDMQNLYVKVLELGYREMPQRMYLEWLTSVEDQKNKYKNQKISDTFKSKASR